MTSVWKKHKCLSKIALCTFDYNRQTKGFSMNTMRYSRTGRISFEMEAHRGCLPSACIFQVRILGLVNNMAKGWNPCPTIVQNRLLNVLYASQNRVSRSSTYDGVENVVIVVLHALGQEQESMAIAKTKTNGIALLENAWSVNGLPGQPRSSIDRHRTKFAQLLRRANLCISQHVISRLRRDEAALRFFYAIARVNTRPITQSSANAGAGKAVWKRVLSSASTEGAVRE